jgi:hypothetical protein
MWICLSVLSLSLFLSVFSMASREDKTMKNECGKSEKENEKKNNNEIQS